MLDIGLFFGVYVDPCLLHAGTRFFGFFSGFFWLSVLFFGKSSFDVKNKALSSPP